MDDNARRRHEHDAAEPPTRRADPFSLEAYLERQRAEFADGPTMAEILEEMDQYRADGLPGDLIVASIREDREANG
jgi:hypothetical protein